MSLPLSCVCFSLSVFVCLTVYECVIAVLVYVSLPPCLCVCVCVCVSSCQECVSLPGGGCLSSVCVPLYLHVSVCVSLCTFVSLSVCVFLSVHVCLSQCVSVWLIPIVYVSESQCECVYTSV